MKVLGFSFHHREMSTCSCDVAAVFLLRPAAGTTRQISNGHDLADCHELWAGISTSLSLLPFHDFGPVHSWTSHPTLCLTAQQMRNTGNHTAQTRLAWFRSPGSGIKYVRTKHFAINLFHEKGTRPFPLLSWRRTPVHAELHQTSSSKSPLLRWQRSLKTFRRSDRMQLSAG